MSKCPKCDGELREYECSRTETTSTAPHRPSECIASLRAQLAASEAKLADERKSVSVLLASRDDERGARVDLEAQLAASEAGNRCDACGGDGKPESGLPCMCNGSGRMSDAALTLRELLAVSEAKAERLENAARSARGTLLSISTLQCGGSEAAQRALGRSKDMATTAESLLDAALREGK